jgi:hypothetical protein
VIGRDAREVATYAADESRLALERELLDADRTRIELTARRKDGTFVDVELISVAVRDETASADLLRFAGRRREQERADRQAIERLTTA